MKKLLIALVAGCLGTLAWAQTAGVPYVLYGHRLFPLSAFINASTGARVDTIDYYVGSTLTTFSMRGNAACSLKDSIDWKNSKTRTDTLIIRPMDVPWVNIGVQFVVTPDSGSGAFDSCTVKLRGRVNGTLMPLHDDIADAEYQIKLDSTTNGYWGGSRLLSRGSMFTDTVYITIVNQEPSKITLYRPIIRVPMSKEVR